MTKPEVPVAVLMAVTIGVIGYATLGSSERRSAAAIMLMFGAGSLLGPACFWTYFRAHMQPSLATRSVAAAWLPVFNSAILNNQYYAHISGLDEPARNIALMVLLFAGTLATIWIVARLSSTKSSKRWRVAEIKDACRVAVLAALAPLSQWLPIGRVLPLIGLAALAVAIRLFWKHRHNRHDAIRHLALVMWCTFSVALLAKMALRATILHYGFYLALPAVTVAVISICWIVPGFLDRWRPGSAAREFRWFATLAVAAVILPLLLISQQRYATKRLGIGGGGDRFYGSNVADGVDTPQAILAREALQTILQDAKPNDTLTVLPEGVMLNYLSRLESPLRVVTVMPPELLTFGEGSIIQSLRAAPPTFVVFVHRTTGEYGLPLFGTDPRYGQRTMDWVKARYRSIRTLGNQPLTESGYGIEIFKAISDQAEAQKSPYAAGWRRSN